VFHERFRLRDDAVARRPAEGSAVDCGPMAENTDSVERERLVDVLRSVAGNKQAAARTMGISRRAFYRRLERYGLHVASPMASGGPPRASRA